MLNPLLPPDIFVPDAEAHVWADGRLYLYGSLDVEGDTDYCSGEYRVFSTDDMQHFTDHGVAFSIRDISWAGRWKRLYAPDCAFRNGIYYLYYCIPDGRCGVATSQSPCGPFTDVGPIAHVTMIDPAVLIDDDGQAYIYWGQFDGVRAAKLKENMVEIEPDSITQPLSVREHEFHEGSSVKKIGGKYYYLFTDTHRHGGRATSLGYAVSDHPTHGFTYGGVIVDNFGCDPETWNNHGSLQQFHGQWYIFYHRASHGSKYSRRVCAEPITFESDGSIREAAMTCGVGHPLAANIPLAAHRVTQLSGHACVKGGKAAAVCDIQNGDTTAFRSLAFNGENTVTLKAKATAATNVEVRLDGQHIATVTIPPSAQYTTVFAPCAPQEGEHTLELYFFGDGVATLLEIGFSKHV